MEHIFIFAFAIVITIATNHLLLNFSKNLGTRGNEVKQVRWASTSKPSLGGFAFYVVFLGIVAFLGTQDYPMLFINKKQLLGIFTAVSIGFFIGFADDTYNTNPLLKFIGQFTCAIVLFFSDIQIQIVPNYTILNFVFTSLWVVGLMNSVNMLDNMDAITASSSIVIISALLIIATFVAKDKNVTFILLAILASLIGFLYHNWNPAKMYMGDAGSQFLGIFLAIFSILFVWGERDANGSLFQFKQFVLPALLFIIPLIDTITVTFRRLIRGQSPFIGGRDHTTHHLVYFGLNERSVAILFIIISIISSSLLLFIFNNKSAWDNIVTFSAGLFFVVIFILIQITYVIGLRKSKLKRKEELPSPVLDNFERTPQPSFENTI